MTAPLPDAVPALFAELAELPSAGRMARLAQLEASDPGVARELRALLDADSSAGDFLGVLAARAAGGGGEAVLGPSPAGGERVGPYRIVHLLGRGGMASVWLAHDERLDRDVALKFIGGGSDPQTGSSADARARLMAEARVVARLEHPNIASVHDVGATPDGEPYIAMAYCEGGSLANRLAAAGGALSVADALRIGEQLASALNAAHARGVVHRDVKPANVLFDANGMVRLADFGIAGVMDQDATRTGTAWGTVAYLAPEQLRGEAVDARADLWAFGVTLYEMLSGRRPFEGGSRAAVLYAILTERPAPIEWRGAAATDARADVEALVFRMLDKDPHQRPASVAVVEHALMGIRQILIRDGQSHEAAGPSADSRSSVPLGARVQRFAPPPSLTALTPLIGRERELALAAALLDRTRLLTLTGPGGTGKTRLATELARLTMPGFPDGVHLVALASTASASLVPSAIAQTLGIRESATANADDRVLQYFAGAHALLVLDNAEHVLDAARFVRTLLTAAPHLTVLITSRAPLRIQGEQEFPVPALELPAADAVDAQAIGAAEAVRLFVQCARAGRPDFVLGDDNAADIAAICRRLDGLPLAIELAATRIKLLGPRALRSRIEQRLDLLRSDARDVAPRHRTLRDVVDWSYDLLDPPGQALLRGLAIFVNGFTLDAAAAIAHRGDAPAPDGGSVAALDAVAGLVDRSLIMRRDQPDGEPRFHMLETIRAYALERLRHAGEEPAARAAHRAYFLSLAERAAPYLRGPSQVVWLAQLEQEHDNLRAALDDSLAADDLASGVRLAVALQWFWLGSRSFIGQTIERLQALDDRTHTGDHGVPTDLRARLLTTLGMLTSLRGDHFDVPYRYHEVALALYEQTGDAVGAATTLNHLGWTSYLLGETARAASFSRDALMRHRAAGNVVGIATASVNLGWVAMTSGTPVEAARLFGEALEIHRRRGDRRASAYALGHLASATVLRGDLSGALAMYDEVRALAEPLGDRVLGPTFRTRAIVARYEAGASAAESVHALETEVLPLLRDAGHAWSLGFILACIGAIRTDAGSYDRARTALDESLAIRRRAGDRSGVAHTESLLGEWARRVGDRRAAAERWAASLRERHAMGEILGIAECFEGIAALAVDTDDAARAGYLLAASASMREQLGAPLRSRAVSERDRLRADVERTLGAESLAAAAAEGQSAPLEDRIAVAQAMLDRAIASV